MTLSKKRLKRIFILSLVLIISELIYLGFDKEIVTIDPVIQKLMEVFLTFVVSLLFINILLRLSEKRVWTMFEKEMELEQRIIVSRLYAIGLYSLGLFITFWKAGVSIGNLTIFIGLVASGFAFAIRDILLSFFAWFIILNRKPFKMGDYVKLEDYFGIVTRIGTFYFTIEVNSFKEFVKIPNSLVLSKPISIKGNGHFRDEVQVHLKTVPNDFSEISKELQSFIKSRLNYPEPVRIQLLSEQSGWLVHISFSNSFEQDTFKAAIYLEVYRLFNSHLKISN